jgi:hypothetical protein
MIDTYLCNVALDRCVQACLLQNIDPNCTSACTYLAHHELESVLTIIYYYYYLGLRLPAMLGPAWPSTSMHIIPIIRLA